MGGLFAISFLKEAKGFQKDLEAASLLIPIQGKQYFNQTTMVEFLAGAMSSSTQAAGEKKAGEEAKGETHFIDLTTSE